MACCYPLSFCFHWADAVALFPLLEDDLLLIVQVEAVAFAVADAAVQVDEPFPYEKLPVTVTDHCSTLSEE